MGVPLDCVRNFHAPIVRSLASFENGRFCFDNGFGQVAFATCIYDEDAESLIDLVAWPARDPEAFGTLIGSPVLGIDQLMNPASFIGKPCMLHTTPLAWFQSGCSGAVILDLVGARTALRCAPGAFTTATLEGAKTLLSSGVVPGNRLLVPAEWGRAP